MIASTADIVLVDGYGYTNSTGLTVTATNVNAYVSGSVNYVPVGTKLTIASVPSGETIQAVNAAGAVIANVANNSGSTTNLTLEMPAADVTLNKITTPVSATLEVSDPSGNGGQSAWEKTGELTGVYTAKNGAKINVTFSAVSGMTGDEITIRVKPQRAFNSTVTLGSTTLTWTSSDSEQVAYFTLSSAGANTLTITDGTTAAHVLTVPAGVTASGTGVTANGTNTYLVEASSSVSLTGLSAAYYLKAGTSYVKDGSASFTMPSSDLEITADKYHKITSVTVDATTDSNVNTNLGGVTVVAPSNLDNTYVKEGGSVTVTFTLGGTGEVATNPINIAMDALSGLTSGSYATAQELLAVSDTQATDISGKADTVTVGEVATADFTIAYSLTTSP